MLLGFKTNSSSKFFKENNMQPIKDTVRRVALCVLFISSVIAICVMSGTAQADGMQEGTDNTVLMTEAEELELELQADAEAVETRDGRIALYVDYVQVSGVTTELEGEEVYAPVRFFAESMLDCSVVYSEGTKTLNISADGMSFEAICGKPYICSNGRYLYVEDGISLREDGQIWLPVSLLAEIFGYEYRLDLDSKSVYLTPTGEYLEHGDTYYNSKDLHWLSRIINAESRGEPFEGQLAVGTVVMNRVANPRYPNTVYGVIFDGVQFSPAVSGTIHKAPHAECVIAAKLILEGYRISDTILYFHAVNPVYYKNFENTESAMVIGKQYYYTNYRKK